MKDLIIIGTGSAGLPAGMYASRYKISNLIIGAMPGGALATSHNVENYPGFTSVGGKELMDRMADHAKKSGSEIMYDTVMDIEFLDGIFQVKTMTGKEESSRFLLLATGNKYRHLGVPGEKEFLGKGVSYCATCDGMFFKDREIVIVGGGDAAVTEALYLSEICSKVHLLHRRDSFRAEDIWVDKVEKQANIEIHYNTEVAEIKGKMFVEEILLKDGASISADGIFVAVGSDPDTVLVNKFNLEIDDSGCITVDKRQETSMKKLYAAGDVTTNSNKFKQTIMSAAEGALAVNSIHEDLLKGV